MKRYFITRNSHMYSYIAHMPKHMRYIVSAIFLLSITFLWYMTFYRYIDARIQSYDAHARMVCMHVQEMSELQEQCDALQAACAQLQSALMPLSKQQDISDDQDALLVLDLLRTQGLHLNSYTMDRSAVNKQSGECTMHLNVRGSLSQLIQFLNTLLERATPVQCSRCMCVMHDALHYTITFDLIWMSIAQA